VLIQGSPDDSERRGAAFAAEPRAVQRGAAVAAELLRRLRGDHSASPFLLSGGTLAGRPGAERPNA